MWDGAVYETEDQARQTAQVYRQNGFDVQLFEEAGQHLVYSRRLTAVQTAS